MSVASLSRVEGSLTTNNPWLFLSPHLDDAVLSCGALMESAANNRKVVVATLFTEAGPAPYTRAARSFLRQCSAHDAGDLFEARRREDAAVFNDLGVQPIHLGATDALFRKREEKMVRSGVLGRALPELVHRYPTYRFDIALGRISRGDASLISRLRDSVAGLIQQHSADLVFCPVGVGRHVDHLITRMVGEAFTNHVVYYSDFPYDQTFQPDEAFLDRKGLGSWLWEDRIPAKHRLVRKYATQADALFPDGRIPVAPETYYVPVLRT
ncbi:PIG-L deacetylase family protein [Arthrobacter sp. KNU-44]|uniref:PIG-L deacetylase family protein n=1 Tax=unclassified Arthrobacter TaxID=235627 RepID=UPI003F4269FB